MYSSKNEKSLNQLNDGLSIDNEINDEIINLKVNLLPNDIYEPIFFNYYNNMVEIENISDEKNLKQEYNKISDEIMPIYQELIKKEEIHKVKVNLFLILKMKCRYKNEYKDIIFNKYIECKRLIIQKYEVKDNKIQFGPKEYCFTLKNNNKFHYLGKIIEYNKGKLLIFNREIMTEKKFKKKNNNISNLDDEEKDYKNPKKCKKTKKSINSDDLNIEKGNHMIVGNLSTISLNTKKDNKSISQINKNSDLNISSISETSDNEINGEKFFDEKYRYIYLFYKKEIYGVYSSHPPIVLNKKEKIDLKESLNSLLKDN